MHLDRPPWLATTSDADLHWLAGLLEGEGSFLRAIPSAPNRPIVQVAMTDEDVVSRVSAILNVRYYVQPDRRSTSWKPYYGLQLRGRRAVELMRLLRPLMGDRRRAQIDTAVANWAPKAKRISREQGDDILAAIAAGEPVLSIAARFGVTKWSIYSIKRGRYFAAA